MKGGIYFPVFAIHEIQSSEISNAIYITLFDKHCGGNTNRERVCLCVCSNRNNQCRVILCSDFSFLRHCLWIGLVSCFFFFQLCTEDLEDQSIDHIH